jgi:chemotaxis signal transduction protein
MRKRIGLSRAKLEVDSQKLLDIVTGSSQTENVIIFRLGENPWAISMNHIIKIISADKIQYISGSSDISFVRGYMKFQNQDIPVISLHRLLGLPSISEVDLKTAIIVCTAGDVKFGLVSEEVLEIVPMSRSLEITSIPRSLLKSHKRLLAGALNWRNKVAIYMNLIELFKKEDLDIIRQEARRVREGAEE